MVVSQKELIRCSGVIKVGERLARVLLGGIYIFFFLHIVIRVMSIVQCFTQCLFFP